jgi:hypothetical protein
VQPTEIGISSMAKKTVNHEAAPLLITVLRSVDEATSGKRRQWVDVGSLHLDDEEDRIVASFVLAERLGWLQIGPAHSVAITDAGRKQIAKR